ncbi:ABC transporter ATP-binding protein, partial [Opitutales bacterium]|nr:ABC transporter ATP-binding protein [Opitutales bacterium]
MTSLDNEVLIKVENVSKKFCRDFKKSLWYGLKDTATDVFNFNNNKPKKELPHLREGEFWANQNISFEVKRGESLGLIGYNGAGKTTLLKMLNGLIKPDTGSIEMHGKVGALIALGAGFNPILTGRENIYVNGSILGLHKKEIEGKLDEIIEFAELEAAIDAPVRTYSSGMQVRLGFAIAAVITKPNILLLDEVLAVGDFKFRAKCLSRVNELKQSGTSLILVSHIAQQIIQNTDKCLYLHNGRVQALGETREIYRLYENQNNEFSLNEDEC